MDKAKIPEILREAGLGEYVEAILSYLKPCIRLHSRPVELTESLPPGASYIGGLPDLPPKLAWPMRHGRLCEFIAQINLSEVSAYDPTGLLPKEGVLFFFFDNRFYEDNEYQPYQKGGDIIRYHGGTTTELKRVSDYPDGLEEWQRYNACSIQFETDWMLPSSGNHACYQVWRDVFHGTHQDPETPAMKAYYELTHALTPYEGEDQHHLLGYAEPAIQDDPFYQVPWDKQKSRDEALAHWVLLLQISSNDSAVMQFDDSGSLYYCIHKDDLAAKRFEKAVCVLQFY